MTNEETDEYLERLISTTRKAMEEAKADRVKIVQRRAEEEEQRLNQGALEVLEKLPGMVQMAILNGQSMIEGFYYPTGENAYIHMDGHGRSEGVELCGVAAHVVRLGNRMAGFHFEAVDVPVSGGNRRAVVQVSWC